MLVNEDTSKRLFPKAIDCAWCENTTNRMKRLRLFEHIDPKIMYKLTNILKPLNCSIVFGIVCLSLMLNDATNNKNLFFRYICRSARNCIQYLSFDTHILTPTTNKHTAILSLKHNQIHCIRTFV